MSQPATPSPAFDPAAVPGAPVCCGEDGTERAISSDALLAGRACVTIDHQGMQYVLRATRAGKLILTK